MKERILCGIRGGGKMLLADKDLIKDDRFDVPSRVKELSNLSKKQLCRLVCGLEREIKLLKQQFGVSDEVDRLIIPLYKFNAIKKEIETLRKVVDKACDELAKQNHYEYWSKSESFYTKEEWMEYFSK